MAKLLGTSAHALRGTWLRDAAVGVVWPGFLTWCGSPSLGQRVPQASPGLQWGKRLEGCLGTVGSCVAMPLGSSAHALWGWGGCMRPGHAGGWGGMARPRGVVWEPQPGVEDATGRLSSLAHAGDGDCLEPLTLLQLTAAWPRPESHSASCCCAGSPYHTAAPATAGGVGQRVVPQPLPVPQSSPLPPSPAVELGSLAAPSSWVPPYPASALLPCHRSGAQTPSPTASRYLPPHCW